MLQTFPNIYKAGFGDEMKIGIAGNFISLIDSFAPSVVDMGIETDLSQTSINLGDGGGDRDEIGLFTESQAEWLAIRNNPAKSARSQVLMDYFIAQADEIKNYPWADKTALQAQSHPQSVVSGNYSHFPNVFFLPALLTENDTQREAFIAAMRNKYYSSAAFWLNEATPNTNYWIDLQSRGWAWALRELAQLAYMEREGLITDSALGNTEYRTALANNLTHVNAQMLRNEVKGTHALGSEIYKDMDGRNDRASVQWLFCHWMQTFVSMTISYIIKLGFTDWLPVAEFNFQHYQKKKDNWGWWAFDGDYSFQDSTVLLYDALATQQEKDDFDWWANTPFEDRISDGANTTERSDALLAYNAGAGWPSNLIVDTVIDGVRISYNSRIDNQLMALGMFASVGVAGASALQAEALQQKTDRITRGGGLGAASYRFSFEWRT